MRKRVVVTGLGVVSSIGIGKDAFWNNLIQGKSGISKVTAFDTSAQANHNGGQVQDFNASEFINKKKANMMGRASQLITAAAKLAIKDSILNLGELSRYQAAVSIGTTLGELPELEKIDIAWTKKGKDEINKLLVYQFPTTNISSNVAIAFNLKGPNRVFTTACAAGNYAIGFGYDLIQSDEADLVLAGGVDAFSWIPFTGFNQLRSMAPEKCQPFDKNRQGMLLGEGAAVLILETAEGALKRNAPVYAEILGYGLSCDGYHMTNTQPEGILSCMKSALTETGLSIDDIDYICAHGTGTRQNDKAESAAIKSLFGDRYKKIPVSSIKSMLGHTMGAASAIEAVSCCLTIKNDIIPPTINYETPDPECDIDCVPNKARNKKTDIVLNNGFAFGGNNACLALRKFKK